MASTLGEKIKELRKEKGLTLEGLGKMTGSTKSYIWELENKNPPRPSAEKIDKIATVLGVTSAYLLDEQEKSPDPDVLDEAFFRNYRRLDEPTKEKLRLLIKLWDEAE